MLDIISAHIRLIQENNILREVISNTIIRTKLTLDRFFRRQQISDLPYLSSFLSLTDDPAQCFFGHHQIGRVALDPTGNHRAMNQCKNCLRLRNTFLFRKAKSRQMIRIEFLPVIVESAAVNYRTKKMGYNAAKELYKRVQANLARRD